MKISPPSKAALLILIGAIAILLQAGYHTPASAQIEMGQPAPLFTLRDADGMIHNLSDRRNDALVLLYFSDAEAHKTPDLLITLSEMRRQLPDDTINVWGVCSSPAPSISSWIRRHRIDIPVLIDEGGRVAGSYNANLVQPTLVIIGPDLIIHDLLHGPEARPGDRMVLVARRLHERGLRTASQWLCEKVLERHPTQLDAQHLLATIMLQSGSYAKAERIFFNISRRSTPDDLPGLEGLAAVYAARGEIDRAHALTNRIAQQAKKRSMPLRLQGDIDLVRGVLDEAQKKYKKALKKKDISPIEAARLTNHMGLVAMALGKGDKARHFFEDAYHLEPLYLTARYNLGFHYQSEGVWERAREIFERLAILEPESVPTAMLAAQVADEIALGKDREAQGKLAAKVTALAGTLSKGPWEWVAAEDDWTTESLKLALIQPFEMTGFSERAGYPVVTNRLLQQRLTQSGRVALVDPFSLAQLLHKMDIPTDAMATTAFATKLGRVLGARIVGLGGFRHGVGPSELTYRLIDARVGAELARIELPVPSYHDLADKVTLLADRILEAAVKSTPLQAYVVEVKEGRALLNLGARQGVTIGRFFNVIEEQLFVEYKGKTLYPDPVHFARLEVIEVAPDFSFARIIDQARPIKRDDKAIEDITDMVASDLSQ